MQARHPNERIKATVAERFQWRPFFWKFSGGGTELCLSVSVQRPSSYLAASEFSSFLPTAPFNLGLDSGHRLSRLVTELKLRTKDRA